MEVFGPLPPAKRFVLCFDGTGNKFAGDESDTNVLKIYRMLDRSQSHQYHYYQPGIGTYVTSHSLSTTTGRIQRIKSAYKKAKDAAVGSSFDEHVLGGYRFLMRYYSPGDEIYMFGFSRGSYTARFLAEMLDYVGLLQPGNEELIRFAWKTFARWQQRRDPDTHEKHKLYNYMKAFRETFSRPVEPVKFLGLFDTVNSVPMFENPWMERSKFPYSVHSTAKIIRHAVSIDERRAKFHQDLISEVKPWMRKPSYPHHHLRQLLSHEKHDNEAPVPDIVLDAPDGKSHAEVPDSNSTREQTRYRAHSPNRQSLVAPPRNQFGGDKASIRSYVSGLSLKVPSIMLPENEKNNDDQDIAEVWFAGQHGDVGGGWQLSSKDPYPLNHLPLVWMIKEAQIAGLEFDPIKLRRFNCSEECSGLSFDKFCKENGDASASGAFSHPHPTNHYHDVVHNTVRKGVVHDCLTYGGGLSLLSTLGWRLMEYLPFRRMDLQPDGSWKPISWPLPRGEVRDMPDDAQIHVSVIERMQRDPKYRPGNLIVGGGGRGVKRAPAKYGIGEWEVCKHEGDPVRMTYIRKTPTSICRDDEHP